MANSSSSSSSLLLPVKPKDGFQPSLGDGCFNGPLLGEEKEGEGEGYPPSSSSSRLLRSSCPPCLSLLKNGICQLYNISSPSVPLSMEGLEVLVDLAAREIHQMLSDTADLAEFRRSSSPPGSSSTPFLTRRDAELATEQIMISPPSPQVFETLHLVLTHKLYVRRRVDRRQQEGLRVKDPLKPLSTKSLWFYQAEAPQDSSPQNSDRNYLKILQSTFYNPI